MQTACGTRLAGGQTVPSQETVFLFTDAQKELWRERALGGFGLILLQVSPCHSHLLFICEKHGSLCYVSVRWVAEQFFFFFFSFFWGGGRGGVF